MTMMTPALAAPFRTALMLLLASSTLAGCSSLSGLPDGGALQAEPVVRTPYAQTIASYLQGTSAELAEQPAAATQAYLGSLAEDPDNLPLRMRSMNLALLGNDIPTALRLARTLPAQHARPTMTQLLLGAGSIKDGRLKEARDPYLRLTADNPEILQLQAMLQRVKVADGVPVTEAVKVLQSLVLPAGLEGRRQYQIARLWLNAGRVDEAIQALETANAKEPGTLFTTVLLGNLYERYGRPDAALALYQAFARNNPSSGLLEGLDARIRAGRKPEPLPNTLADDVSTTMIDFALLLWAQGAQAPARQLVNVALWLNDDQDPWLAYYGGVVEEYSGDPKLAQVRYARAAKAEGLTLAARLREAEVLRRSGDLKEARRLVRTLTRTYPQDPAVWRLQATQALAADDYPAAVEGYTRLESLLPKDSDAGTRADILFAKGTALERMGQHEAAEQALKASLDLEPANPQTLNYLGYMWVDRGVHLEQAFQMLQKAMLLAPNDGAITDSLGWAYYKRGDYPQAMLYLERAVELVPDDATVGDHLGDVYAKLGRRSEARQEWQRALELINGDDEPVLRQSIQDKLDATRP